MLKLRFACWRCARRLGASIRYATGIAIARDPIAALAAFRFVQTGKVAGIAEDRTVSFSYKPDGWVNFPPRNEP